MRTFLAIWQRELTSYFHSPIAYIALVFFLAFMGVGFGILVLALSEGLPAVTLTRALFGDSPFLWFALMIVIPIITMRLFSEEKRSGTLETLLTAPVGDAEVVLAKFFGALCFYVVLWLPTASYMAILRFILPDAPLDWGPLLSSYLGILVVGAFYLSIGLLASSLTRNQIVAAIVSFGMIALMIFGGMIPYFSPRDEVQALGAYIFALDHLREFSWGVVDSRPIVLYLSATAWTLFATVKVIESRKWK